MSKQKIHISKGQLKQMVNECVRQVLKETNSYGWEVDTEDAELAYDFMAEQLGNEELNAAIVRAMGSEPLSQIMAYLLRMYDMRGWEEYRDAHRN